MMLRSYQDSNILLEDPEYLEILICNLLKHSTYGMGRYQSSEVKAIVALSCKSRIPVHVVVNEITEVAKSRCPAIVFLYFFGRKAGNHGVLVKG